MTQDTVPPLVDASKSWYFGGTASRLSRKTNEGVTTTYNTCHTMQVLEVCFSGEDPSDAVVIRRGHFAHLLIDLERVHSRSFFFAPLPGVAVFAHPCSSPTRTCGRAVCASVDASNFVKPSSVFSALRLPLFET
ncbi:unnamed protein product [Ectocarpus sp. 12 AP-2014]